ncbi:MAG: response regulator transcription factor, partial [Cyclobacteriaceae bacterium]
LMLIKMAFTVAGKRISALQTLIYFLSITVLLTAIGWLLGDETDLAQLELYFYGGAELLLFVFFFAISWTAIKKIEDSQKQNSYRNFCWLLLLGLMLRLGLLPFLSWSSWFLTALLLVYFVGNLLPVWFLRWQADKLFPSYTAELNDQNSFDQLITKHRISKRETEIVKLICQGKTNQQIADALFISLQTVKDHNHRIYTKIGIRSRMQLINLVK